MKRIVHFLTSALLLSVAATPAWSLNITAVLATALSDVVDASRANRTALLNRTNFVISTFDKQTVEAFGTAWRRSGNGSQPREGVVLILRMANGGYSAREMGASNEHRRFTFRWHPATIAVVHTHPNTSDPRPQDEDLLVAEKYQVPVFTITNRGMYVYDPHTRKISIVMANLDWLDISNWRKRLFTLQ
jgi:hypothetical protein